MTREKSLDGILALIEMETPYCRNE